MFCAVEVLAATTMCYICDVFLGCASWVEGSMHEMPQPRHMTVFEAYCMMYLRHSRLCFYIWLSPEDDILLPVFSQKHIMKNIGLLTKVTVKVLNRLLRVVCNFSHCLFFVILLGLFFVRKGSGTLRCSQVLFLSYTADHNFTDSLITSGTLIYKEQISPKSKHFLNSFTLFLNKF